MISKQRIEIFIFKVISFIVADSSIGCFDSCSCNVVMPLHALYGTKSVSTQMYLGLPFDDACMLPATKMRGFASKTANLLKEIETAHLD